MSASAGLEVPARRDRTRAPGCVVPLSGSSAPSTFTVVVGETVRATAKPGWPMSTVRWPSPGGDAMRRRRASDCEVAARAGAEFPRVVDGQVHLRRRGGGQRPRRRERIGRGQLGVGDRQAEAGLAAELERRHDAGDVVGVRRQQARADQPRQRQLRRAVQRVPHRVGIAVSSAAA